MTSTYDPVSTDLSSFGNRELALAAELLTALTARDGRSILGDGVTVATNSNSGYVFLTDEDYNVAMMNGSVLERWFVCSECGHEGFAEDLDDDHATGEWFGVHHYDSDPRPINDDGTERYCRICREWEPVEQ